jgi:hypothetical protein
MYQGISKQSQVYRFTRFVIHGRWFNNLYTQSSFASTDCFLQKFIFIKVDWTAQITAVRYCHDGGARAQASGTGRDLLIRKVAANARNEWIFADSWKGVVLQLRGPAGDESPHRKRLTSYKMVLKAWNYVGTFERGNGQLCIVT